MAKKNEKKVTNTPLQAPKKLKVLVSIVDRRKVDFYLSTLEGYGIINQEVIYAQGTTPRNITDLLGIQVTEKAVILSLVREEKIKKILANYEDKYFLTRNGKGIAFTIPIKSMIGVTLYQFLAGIERE